MTIEADGMMQLDEFDVPAAVLAAPGVRLVDLIGENGAASVDDMLGPPPADGWRVVAGDLSAPDLHPPALAAPWTNRDATKWMMLGVYRFEGQWRTVVNGTGSVARPGRASRRAGLALDWMESPMVASVGTVPTLGLRLRNVGHSRWRADGLDYDHVQVWALGPDSERLMVDHRAWGMVGVSVKVLPSLDPGAAVVLTATWQPRSVENLPAGDYRLEAQLLPLELPCSPGVLRLV